MRYVVKLFFIFLFCFLFQKETKAQVYFPPLSGAQWDTVSKAQLNWCEDSIPSLLNFVEANNSKAFLVLVDGKIVIEKYFGTFQQDSIWYWASAGKSLLATTLGIAAQEKLLDIEDPSSLYLDSNWSSCSSSEELKIKIKHHLSMTTGLNDNVPDVDCTLPSCLNCIAEPAERWAYHNAPYTLLEEVMVNAAGMSLNQYLNNTIKAKTGMTGIYLKQGYNNVFFSTTRSMARFGLLAMNNFVWGNDTVLKDGTYKTQMTNTSQALNLSYGYLWWLNGKASFMLPQSQFVFNSTLLPDAPSDLFSALGKNGQIINVIPSKKMVVIRIGNQPNNANELPMIFNNEIWKRLNNIMCGFSHVDNNSESIKIYPNPSSSYINISGIETTSDKINLYNSLGQIQHISFINNRADIHDLPKGIYVLEIKKNNTIIQKKIIIN